MKAQEKFENFKLTLFDIRILNLDYTTVANDDDPNTGITMQQLIDNTDVSNLLKIVLLPGKVQVKKKKEIPGSAIVEITKQHPVYSIVAQCTLACFAFSTLNWHRHRLQLKTAFGVACEPDAVVSQSVSQLVRPCVRIRLEVHCYASSDMLEKIHSSFPFSSA